MSAKICGPATDDTGVGAEIAEAPGTVETKGRNPKV